MNNPIITAEELQNLSKYISILLTVHSRVSTQKPESQSFQDKGSIDKIVIHLKNSVRVSELQLKGEGLSFKVTRLQDKKFWLQITSLETNHKLYCFLGVQDNEIFFKVQLNPSHFKTYEQCETFLIKVFGSEVLEAKIARLDLTFDKFESYPTVIEGLDISLKHSKTEWSDKTSRTGLLVGSGNDKLNIYDKGKETKSRIGWTRIERQLTGPKVPIKKLGSLKSDFHRILEIDPFGLITLNKLLFIPEATLKAGEQKKLMEFKTLVQHAGLYLARKKLNKNNNFRRDYSPLFRQEKIEIQPGELFSKHFLAFFGANLQ